MTPAKICPVCGKQYGLSDRFCPTDGAVLRSPEAAGNLVGQIIAERYHVLQKLGEGGMGQVYLAEHLRMGRKSAVKVMSPALSRDADAISRFNREASNASRISHPSVAAIYDFGETPDGLIYLAMEYVDGEPLTKLIERQGALLPARAASIVRQTGDALAAAHELGIVHRDLKPDNIMIARARDGSDCVKVVDFGIAKAAGSDAQNVTRTGLVVGTPEYMSPEQLAGDPLDVRSDVYSLGLVAFTMLTGTLPFPSETAQESMIMRLTERPRSLADMRPAVRWPESVQKVIDRALQREVKARYGSAAEMGRDLEAALRAMPEAGVSEGVTLPIAAHAMPRTRVAAAEVPTAILPAERASTTPSHRRRLFVPALAGLGLVAILSAAGAAYTRGGDEQDGTREEAGAGPDSGAARLAAGAGVSRVGTDTTDASRARPVPDDVVPLRQSATIASVSDNSSRRGTRDPEPAVGPAAVEARLQAAREVVDANLQADRVDAPALRQMVAVLTRTLSDVTSFSDSVEVRYLRAQGLGLVGDTERSCGELDDLVSLDLPPRLRTEIGALRASACQ